jgi:hypothetical protein
MERWPDLVLVDLPVDIDVVLEHEERTGEVQCAECPLSKCASLQ